MGDKRRVVGDKRRVGDKNHVEMNIGNDAQLGNPTYMTTERLLWGKNPTGIIYSYSVLDTH